MSRAELDRVTGMRQLKTGEVILGIAGVEEQKTVKAHTLIFEQDRVIFIRRRRGQNVVGVGRWDRRIIEAIPRFMLTANIYFN